MNPIFAIIGLIVALAMWFFFALAPWILVVLALFFFWGLHNRQN